MAELINVNLPNATIGKQYSFIIDLKAYGEIAVIYDTRIDGLEGTGLLFNSEKLKLSGIPSKSGNFNFNLSVEAKNNKNVDFSIDLKLNLIVNQDPRSMWKSLPSDKDDIYWKEDKDFAFIKTPDRSLVAASIRGRSHAHKGGFRDDDFDTAYSEKNGWYIMTVADGAGSAKNSRHGSWLSSFYTTEYLASKVLSKEDDTLEELLENDIENSSEESRKKIGDWLYSSIGNAVFQAIKAISQEAELNKDKPNDYATTLLVCICKKIKNKYFIGSYWVGDGALVVYEKGKSVKLLGSPDGGEYAGQTRFITMPEIAKPVEIYKRLRYLLVDDFTAIVMMTDGVSDPIFQTENNLKELKIWDKFWGKLYQAISVESGSINPGLDLCTWLDFWSAGDHDDRTMAILYK